MLRYRQRRDGAGTLGGAQHSGWSCTVHPPSIRYTGKLINYQGRMDLSVKLLK